MLSIVGVAWARQPTILPALIFGVASPSPVFHHATGLRPRDRRVETPGPVARLRTDGARGVRHRPCPARCTLLIRARPAFHRVGAPAARRAHRRSKCAPYSALADVAVQSVRLHCEPLRATSGMKRLASASSNSFARNTPFAPAPVTGDADVPAALRHEHADQREPGRWIAATLRTAPARQAGNDAFGDDLVRLRARSKNMPGEEFVGRDFSASR